MIIMKNHQRKFFHYSGYTLIELIVVILVVGIVLTAGVSMMGYSLFRRSNTFSLESDEMENKRALTEIQYLLRTAASFSITDSATYSPTAYANQGDHLVTYHYRFLNQGDTTPALIMSDILYTPTTVTGSNMIGTLQITQAPVNQTGNTYVYTSNAMVNFDTSAQINRPFSISNMEGNLMAKWYTINITQSSPIVTSTIIYATQTIFKP